MDLSWLMALQMAAVAESERVAVPIQFDLATHRPAPPECGSENGADIVVCGRRSGDSRYRVPDLGDRFPEKPLVAEVWLGNGSTARAYVEGVEIAPGVRSNRVMIGIKTPF